MTESQLPQLGHLELFAPNLPKHLRASVVPANQSDLDNLRAIINTLIDAINGSNRMIGAIVDDNDTLHEGLTQLAGAIDELIGEIAGRLDRLETQQGRPA